MNSPAYKQYAVSVPTLPLLLQAENSIPDYVIGFHQFFLILPAAQCSTGRRSL
jgi:hypothetical protein